VSGNWNSLLLGTKCSDAFPKSLNLFHFHVDRDIRQLLENLSLLSVLQQESFPFNCQGSIKLFNVLISVEWSVGKCKKEFFHFDFCVKFHRLFQPTSVTPGHVRDGLEGWSSFSEQSPQGLDAVGPLVADVAGSAKGSAFCRLSRLEQEILLSLPRGRTRLLDPSLPSYTSGTEQLQCGVFSRSDLRSRAFSWREQHPSRNCLVAISSLACNQATSLWKPLTWKNNIREGSLCC